MVRKRNMCAIGLKRFKSIIRSLERKQYLFAVVMIMFAKDYDLLKSNKNIPWKYLMHMKRNRRKKVCHLKTGGIFSLFSNHPKKSLWFFPICSICLIICYDSAISGLISLILFRIGVFFLGDRAARKGNVVKFST